MPTLIELRDNAIRDARAIAEGAKAAGRDMTPDEVKACNGKLDDIKNYQAQIVAAKESEDMLARIGKLNNGQHVLPDAAQSKTIGEHFVKCVGDRLRAQKNTPGASVSAPEWYGFKAATDPHYTTDGSGEYAPALTQVDTSVVRINRPNAVVADLAGSGTLSGQSITYFVEGARLGAFATVPEGGKKPQMHYDFTTVTESLTKIAGLIKLSDEMVEDLAFLVSEINNRLLYDLGMFEEQQLLNGDGAAPNLRGYLNRNGIQTETAADADDALDAFFRALTKVQTQTGLSADGIVINPADYQAVRLSRDGNGQYLAGGPFTGPYGNGSVVWQPPIWGMRTVVTAAIAKGTVLVGAFQQASTVYRKGGITVSSTNSNVDDFEHNLITTRAEERLALAVRIPAAFVKLTMAPPVGP